jgi:hypothetical protein
LFKCRDREEEGKIGEGGGNVCSDILMFTDGITD